MSRVDGLQAVSEDRVEDVVNTRTTAEFLCTNFRARTVDGGDEHGCEAGHKLQNKRAAVLLTGELHISVRSKFLLGLSHECVQAGLDIG